jgi:SAM-dependent methyltransferase
MPLPSTKLGPAPPHNPHLDEGRVVWDDAWSGRYLPVPYDRQFDDQWRLFLERRIGFCDHTGVETANEYVDDRIEELTGSPEFMLRRRWGPLAAAISRLRGRTARRERRGVGGRLLLEPRFNPSFFQGRRCLDAGCGAGRWSRALQALGGIVTATDLSPHALKSTRRFVRDVRAIDLFELPKAPDLRAAFDFTLCWGVIMCTHDPKVAFESVAATLRPGGTLYIMVYAPTYHAGPQVLEWRARYHRECRTFEEKLAFAYSIADHPENAINLLDMLNTFYNWTIPLETCLEWFGRAGFEDVVLLNRNEPHACGLHVRGSKA